MRTILYNLLHENEFLQNVNVKYINTAPYSPDYNPAEYIIHLLRLKLLHNMSYKAEIQEISDKITEFKNQNLIANKEQVHNIIKHIFKLQDMQCTI